MTPDALIRRCLDRIGESGGTAAAIREEVTREETALLETPGTASALIQAVAGMRAEALEVGDVTEEVMLADCFDLARMEQENDGAHGARFLAEAEAEIARVTASEAVDDAAVTALGRCYTKAGLDVPEALVAYRLALMEQTLEASEETLEEQDAMLDELLQAHRDEPYALHTVFAESLATLPIDVQAAMVAHVTSRDDACCRHLALYWLLNPSLAIRAAAASGLKQQAESGLLDADSVARLPMLRAWLPADVARAALDQTIRAAMRGEAQTQPAPTARRIERCNASLPDGSGSQTLAILMRVGHRREVGLILGKDGYGVKEAYTIPCDTVAEAKQMLAMMEDQMDSRDITRGTLSTLLTARIGESLAKERPPAPGLLDVVAHSGLAPLMPQMMTVPDWLAHLDADGRVSSLSPQRRGQLIRKSGTWTEDTPIVESWYENSSATRHIIESSATEEDARAGLLAHLDQRREVWAAEMFLAALVLRDAAPEKLWMSFAATGSALLKGRPLTKIPIMDQIAATSLAVHHDGESEDSAEGLPVSSDEITALLSRIGVSDPDPAWLDGYFVATLVAPELVEHQAWLSDLLNEAAPSLDISEMKRGIDICAAHYGRIDCDLAAGCVTGLDPASASVWARGFEAGRRIAESLWTTSDLTPEDRTVLADIAHLVDTQDSATQSEVSRITRHLIDLYARNA